MNLFNVLSLSRARLKRPLLIVGTEMKSGKELQITANRKARSGRTCPP